MKKQLVKSEIRPTQKQIDDAWRKAAQEADQIKNRGQQLREDGFILLNEASELLNMSRNHTLIKLKAMGWTIERAYWQHRKQYFVRPPIL